MFYFVESKDEAFGAFTMKDLQPTPHIHTHLELVYMVSGSSVAVVDNKEFLIDTGDLFLSFPTQIHSYHDRSVLDGYLLIFSQDLLEDTRWLFHNRVPVSPVIKADQMNFDPADYLKKVVEKANTGASLDRIAAKGYLLALLGEALPLMNLIPTETKPDSIKTLMNYCAENYTEPLSLDSVAEQLHLNKYYISHIFKQRLNISFTDFINSLRTERACTLLEKGENITDVAFASGFSSVRTFNRIFSRNMKMSPREYIKTKA